MNNLKVKKAIIPVAGLGTRMLPATKAIPKEMLPIVDKPLIQYVVNEAARAGIETIVLITHSSKNAIENHFSKSFELETTLERRIKRQLLDDVQNICPHNINIVHVRQDEALGLAHAIRCAAPVVEGEPFAILLPDVLIDEYLSDPSKDNLAEMVKNFEATGISQVMVEKVPMDMVSNFGIVDLGNNTKSLTPGATAQIKNLIEKPSIKDAPSDLAIVGRYVLSQEIWPLFKETPLGAGGEIQLTDTMRLLLRHADIQAYAMKGVNHDCGRKLGYAETFVDYALQHPAIKDEFLQFLKDKVKELEASTEEAKA